jgi:predicted O-methyltransferase YrrM
MDRELSHTSPLSAIPDSLVDRLRDIHVGMPPCSCFGNGTQSVEGLRFLVALSRLVGVRSAFEIGTFTGVTALTLAINIPQMIIHTLDLPAQSSPALDIDSADRNFIPLQSRRRVFEGRAEAIRITQHEGDSADFDFASFGHTFDLVYVDGAHSYDYVANDSRMAFEVVSDRGLVVWDDYQRSWPGVIRYLDERTDLPLYRVPGTRLVIWLSEQAKSTLPAFDVDR